MNIIYIKSVYIAAVPFFWPQPAFLPDQYQPCTGSQHFATYIKALVPRFTIPASSAAPTSMDWTAMYFTAYFLPFTALNVNYRLSSLSCPLYRRLGARNSRHNETLRFTPNHLLSARGKEKSRIRRSHFYSVISTKRLQVISFLDASQTLWTSCIPMIFLVTGSSYLSAWKILVICLVQGRS